MNKNELKARMARYGDNCLKLAEALGKSPSTISHKLNDEVPFSLSEIQAMIERYDLTPEDVQTIFFARKVAESETKVAINGS